eukprot:TRINITY_DN38042_c0_g1_i1.p1 TRINITY_DN38042_c0_g1~~TRINITY_DN38042_c0_g1_i1.p1  ORF type:complete len:239 (+),score=28.00 TRINITY_DN38042_c0_g1_i1:79-795(+)
MTMMLVLGVSGCAGALLMFAADLLLYYPVDRKHLSAAVYFDRIDPGGDKLHDSPMQSIDDRRMMLGGVLGPVAAVLYGIGFLQFYHGLQPAAGVMLPAVCAISLTMTMAVGAVYHALFVYTGFLAKECKAAQVGGRDSEHAALCRLVSKHQGYLVYVYKWAALPAIVGSAAFVWCCLSRDTLYPKLMSCFVPAMSAPLKKCMKRWRRGGLVLAGGWTNLWNLFFFLMALASALNARTE